MKWADGELVPNPSAQWRIDEGTREMLRSAVTEALEAGWSNDKLADALADSHAFSEQRAEMIARTETARADVEGNLAGYRALGVQRKQWLASEDACEDCEALDGQAVGIDDSFGEHGGFGPPAHPLCRCDLLPVLDDEDGKALKAWNPDQARDEQGRWAGDGGGIAGLASAAAENHESRQRHSLGAVGRSNVEAVAAELRLDLSGYQREASDDELRHALKSHGSTLKEVGRGQRALTSEDFKRLDAVTSKPDSVSNSEMSWRGLRAIVYEKEIGGERFHYVEAIDERAARVRFVSLRVHAPKKKRETPRGPLPCGRSLYARSVPRGSRILPLER